LHALSFVFAKSLFFFFRVAGVYMYSTTSTDYHLAAGGGAWVDGDDGAPSFSSLKFYPSYKIV
jgi:hypothetical protein